MIIKINSVSCGKCGTAMEPPSTPDGTEFKPRCKCWAQVNGLIADMQQAWGLAKERE